MQKHPGAREGGDFAQRKVQGGQQQHHLQLLQLPQATDDQAGGPRGRRVPKSHDGPQPRGDRAMESRQAVATPWVRRGKNQIYSWLNR